MSNALSRIVNKLISRISNEMKYSQYVVILKKELVEEIRNELNIPPHKKVRQLKKLIQMLREKLEDNDYSLIIDGKWLIITKRIA